MTIRNRQPANRQTHMGASVGHVLYAIHRDTPGYVQIFSGRRSPDSGKLEDTQENYIAYPNDIDAVKPIVDEHVNAGREVYWCAHLLTQKRRIKANAAPV